MKTTTIDKSLLPNVCLMWSTTTANFYMDCEIGKKQTMKPEDAVKYSRIHPLINAGSRPRFAYVKYHDDIEALELAEVTIDTTRKEEVKQWRYNGEKYFLKKDKTVVDEYGNEKTNNFILSRNHRSNDFKGFLSMLYRISCQSNADEFKKFLGSNTYIVGSGRCVTVHSCWNIHEWYKTKQKVRGEGKAHQLTNELTKMVVRNIEEISKEYPAPKEYDSYTYNNGRHIIYFETLDNGWHVLRTLNRRYKSDDFDEVERMYLHDDGANRIVTPQKDKWVPSRQYNGWTKYTFANKNEAMEKCDRIKYILPLLENLNNVNIKAALTTILRFPELEQMIRLGYSTAASRVLGSNTPMADLKGMFGDYYNAKGKTIFNKAGLSKSQFHKYMKEYGGSRYYYGYRAKALKEIRGFFGDKLVHLDEDTFTKYYDAFANMCERSYGRGMFAQLKDMNVDRNKFIKNIIRLGEKNKEVYTVAQDTLTRYSGLNTGTHPEINWYFDSYSDLVRAHDAIDELKREQDAERRAMWDMAAAERMKKEEEKRKELDEKRKEWEYEDDNYIIRLPNDGNEIIREGDMQRICIGGYRTSHALGSTNLFFLRKKNDPTSPFYAIEMNNNNIISQIHGYCNKWLGNNPEAIPTVVRWLRKNGFKCSESILTCTATGYGSNNQYVAMPVVD